jgi:hypothetical protein
VEGAVDGYKLVALERRGASVQLAAGLLVELRLIRKPQEGGVLVRWVVFVSLDEALHPCRGNDSLARAGGRSEDQRLRPFILDSVRSTRCKFSQTGGRFGLEVL